MIKFNYKRIESKVYSIDECNRLIEEIEKKNDNKGFGIRYFIRDNPQLLNLIVNVNFKTLLHKYFKEPIIIKSIYFDKPSNANWVVNWHQDITLNLSKKVDLPNYKNWRILSDRVVVQPKLSILESILTFRIHLDSADEKNGALIVIPESEDGGVIRVDKEYLDSNVDKKEICNIAKGGIMVMSPLTVHSSRRSVLNLSRRRVIHLEVIEKELANKIPFLEQFAI